MTGTRGSTPLPWERTLAIAFLIGLGGVLVLSAAAGAVSLQKGTLADDADFFATGGFANMLPSTLSTGDWNGDGYADVVMCSSTNSSCGISMGRPVSTSAGVRADNPEVVLLGPGGAFGFTASFVGDVDGDGKDDVVVGAPLLVGPSGERYAGSAWLFLGRQSSAGEHTTLGYYQAVTHILSAEPNATLGNAIAPAGDLNGDGKGEFWLAAGRLAAPPGALGAVYLFDGRSSWPAELQTSGASLTLDDVTAPGPTAPALLGAVDLDGDTRPDFAVATPRYPNGVGDPVGAAFVFLNPYRHAGSTVGPSAADVTIQGTLNVSGMGYSLAFARDFVVGGVSTLFVSGDFNSSVPNPGAAVYMFRTAGWTCCRTLYGWDAAGLLYSQDPGDAGGTTLATGDFDGDGYTDLVLGSYRSSPGDVPSAGAVYIFYGHETGANPVPFTNATGWVIGSRSYCFLGSTLVAADFNRDGKSDFFAGCPMSSQFNYSPGDVYGFLGRPRNRPPFVTLTGPSSAVEGDNVTISVSIVDPDRDYLHWVYTRELITPGLPKYEHDNEPWFNYTISDEGDVTWTVIVNDGEFSVLASHTFSAVNAPPTCGFVVEVPFEEGKNRSVTVVGQDPGPADVPFLTYAWHGPANMTINGTTAWYRPTRGLPFTVRVDVRDPDGGFGSCVYTVPVANAEPQVFISAATDVLEGEPVGLFADVHDNGTDDALTVLWRTPEGAQVQGPILNWVPTRPGIWTFNLSVSDLDGAVVYRNHTVRVRAVGPDVALVLPSAAVEGEPVTISVNQLSGQSYDPLTISWTLCDHPISSGANYTLLRADPGDFCVEALAVDDDGQFVELRGVLHVANRPPLAGVLVTPPDSYFEGAVVHFEVQLAEWETADISKINVTWRVDGKLAGYGPEFFWKALPGGHAVEARARDPLGAPSVVSYAFDVTNLPPTVYIIGPSSTPPGTTDQWVAFAGDPSGGPVAIEWQVDGELVSHGDTLQWGSPSRGTHTLTATATDSWGNSSTATFHVQVEGTGEIAGIDLGWVPYALTATVAFAVGLYAGRLNAPPAGARREGRRPKP